jgi:crotonobetainyl-CoA:carnitine CoA-transferase CaiB-like acyl-CoA transferase
MSWPTRTAEGAGPLSDIRVLDLSAYAVGPYAASLLAMLGADVIKVDPPYGDPIRAVRPQIDGEPTTYTTSNQGKRDVVLDLKAPADREIVISLAASADVVIENFRSGTLDRLGLGYSELSKLNPRLVFCSSGSFGDKGPMAPVGSTDPHGQAFNGFVAINGRHGEDREFLRYKALIDLATSTYLAASALLGLRHRARTRAGCHFESSQMEAALAVQVNRIAEFFVSGRSPEPYGSGVQWLVPSGAYRCRDHAYLSLTAPTEPVWAALCEVIGRPDLAARPELQSNAGRVEHREEVEAALAEAIATRDIQWWRTRLTAARIPNGEQLALDEAIRFGEAHPLAPFLEHVPHPRGGTIVSAGAPWKFSRTPARITPAPLPGEHDAEVRSGVSSPTAAEAVPVHTNQSGGNPRRTLAGLKVLELAQGIAGPYCGMLLAGTGADVLKLEPPSGDPQRRLGPPFIGDVSASYCAINRGKRVAQMDWRSEEGRRALDQLLAEADVVIVDRGQNGLEPVADFDGRAVPRNRRAIVCGISPAGEEGRLAACPASELEIQGYSGITRYVGSIDAAPLRLGADVGSILSGAFGYQGILAALHERDRSGEGQYVGVSGVAAIVAMETVMIAALSRPDAWEGFHCLAAGYPPEYGVRTRDGAVSFNGPRRDEAAWVSFCREVDAADLAIHPDFDTDAKRLPRSRELSEAIEPYLRSFAKWDVVEVTTRHGGIAVPVQDYAEYFSHPQASAMEVADVWETRSGERFRALGMPWRVDGERPRPGPAPATHAVGETARSEIEAWLSGHAEAVR